VCVCVASVHLDIQHISTLATREYIKLEINIRTEQPSWTHGNRFNILDSKYETKRNKSSSSQDLLVQHKPVTTKTKSHKRERTQQLLLPFVSSCPRAPGRQSRASVKDRLAIIVYQTPKYQRVSDVLKRALTHNNNDDHLSTPFFFFWSAINPLHTTDQIKGLFCNHAPTSEDVVAQERRQKQGCVYFVWPCGL
jgi:hypothetical protein